MRASFHSGVGPNFFDMNDSDHSTNRLLLAEGSVVFAETGRYDVQRSTSEFFNS